MPELHRIRRQRWQIHAPNAESALELRRRLRNELDSALLPAFDRAFAALGLGDEVVHVPKLTIELEVRDVDELLRELAGALAAELRPLLGASPHADAPAPRRLSPAEAELETLVHYLLTGSLPWMQAARAADELAELLARSAESLAADLPAVAAALPDAPDARVVFLVRLLKLLAPESRATFGARALSSLRAATVAGVSIPAETLLVLFDPTRGPARVPERGTRPWTEVAAIVLSAALRARRHGGGEMELTGSELTSLKELLPREALTAESSSILFQTLAGARRSELLPRTVEPRVETPGARPTTHPEPGRRGSAHEEAVERVRAAGLVLLHPYLPRFFEATAVTSGRSLPPEALPRAAALLHFVTTGRDEIFEFELGLVKLLLGLRPDDALPVSAGLLDAADHAECEALLSAAVAHWQALGKTSTAGLRASFLDRHGFLRDQAMGFHLDVEPAAFDLLLSRLPYGIGIVKLPWMPRPLFVQWPTP